MKRLFSLILILFSLIGLSQTNSIVTELYLNNNFTPKGGVTPGTDNTQAMDCDQIKARYNVTISGVTTTGKRLPSQNQLTPSVIVVPIVTTAAITSITDITASGGGNVISDGGSAVTARGIVWSTTTNPTISSYTGITSNGTGTGTFTSSLTSLNCSSTYYVRAYATNSAGTGYGSEVTFVAGYVSLTNYSFWSNITSSCGTGDFTSTRATALQAYYDINNAGCTSKSVTGTPYKMLSTYTVGNQLYTVSQGCKYTGTGYFLSSSTTGANNIVYVSSGIISAIYPLPSAPELATTTTATNIKSTGFTSGGTISYDNGASITAKGVCYGTSVNPTVAGTKTTDGTGTGSFTSTITGLTASTTYYYRSYATNSSGTGYGPEYSMTTQPTSTTITATGSWTCPAGVTSVTVECWGGGGGGGGLSAATTTTRKGGGGSGGQYAKKVITVTPGNVYTVTIGAGGTAGTTAGGTAGTGGDTWFGTTGTVIAKGGAPGTGYTTTGGTAGTGSTANGIGDLVYAGGNGSAGGLSATGGSGGGAAGSTGTGNNASGNTAGAAKTDNGGAGGAGRTTAGNGNAGSSAANNYGGGGGGGYSTTATTRTGGAGRIGVIRLTFP